MPTITQQPGDLQWLVVAGLGTVYADYPTAFAAAIALSAANGNAPVWLAKIIGRVVSENGITVLTTDVQTSTGAFDTYLIQLASGTSYYPQATAIAQAMAAGGGRVARVLFIVTAP